jgi:ParB-like chromosome segregation protein Spo0J
MLIGDTAVSELERSMTTPSQADPHSGSESLSGILGDRPVEREGLPRGFRMRADSHYVDQLDSQYGGPAIRLIPARQIEAADPVPAARVEDLAQSIAAHGILQPLHVRRHHGRYQLIAGRKRLAAALAAGVTEVPCVTHDVDEAQAALLAEADNVRGTASPDGVHPLVEAGCLHQVFRTLSADLSRIGLSAALLKPRIAGALQHQVTADLIQAQTWRAAWLTAAAASVANYHPEGRAKSIGAVLDRVRAGLEAEARLTRLQLETSVAPNAAGLTLDEDLGSVVVTGCIFATLSWMDGVDEPHVEVRADAPNPRTLRVEIVQRMTPVPAELARYLREPGFIPSSDMMTTMGLLAAKSLTVRHGGTAEFGVISAKSGWEPAAVGNRGSVIRCTFCKSQPN